MTQMAASIPPPSDPLLESLAPAIAVLARVEWPAGGATLETAERLGRLLAAKGIAVVSTGYGPLLAAVSRGAALAGGRAVGLPVRSWQVEPSPWLNDVRWVPDSYTQCAVLGACPALVAIGPGPGSLAEAAFTWQIAGRRARLVLLGREWRYWLGGLWRWLVSRPSDLAAVTIVDDVADVLDHLEPGAGGPRRDPEPGPPRRPPFASPREDRLLEDTL